MSCLRMLINAFLVSALALFLWACSEDGDDDTCDSDDDCMVGWGWVCVDHKCVRSDGDEDAEIDGDGESSGVKPCSRISSEAECLDNSERCTWEDDACSVRSYQPDGDYEYEGGNPGSDGSGCRRIYDRSECLSWSQCQWRLGACTVAGNFDDCSKYRSESECQRGYGCEWSGYACVSIW